MFIDPDRDLEEDIPPRSSAFLLSLDQPNSPFGYTSALPIQAMSQSELSTGPSLSSIAEGASLTAPLGVYAGPGGVSVAPEHEAVGPLAPPSPSSTEIELGVAGNNPAKPRPMAKPLLLVPRRFEFSWKDSRLTFAGEPFTAKDVRHRSEASVAGSTRNADVNSSASSSQTRECELWIPRLFEIPLVVQEQMVDILDDYYWRMYRPQRSKKRNQSAKMGYKYLDTASTSPYTRTASTSRPAKPGPSRRRRVTDGSGDSEDEDDHTKGDAMPRARVKETSRYFACPFLKWRPWEFKNQCMCLLDTISHVKDHLVKRHSPFYCKSCFRVFIKEDLLAAHERLRCPRRRVEVVDFMTKEKFDAIKKRADGTKPFEEQWRHIFRILFPDVPWCPSPYMGDLTVERLKHLERVLKDDGRDLLHQSLSTIYLGYMGQYDDELFALFQPACEAFAVRALARLVNLEGGDLALGNHGGTVSWNSIYPNPEVEAGSVRPDIGFPEPSLEGSNRNGAGATPSLMIDPLLYSAQAAFPHQASSLAQSYVGGSVCSTVNPQDLAICPTQSLNVGHHDWDMSVDLHGISVTDACLLGQPTGLGLPLAQQGNLDGNTGDVPHSFTLGSLFDIGNEGFGLKDIGELEELDLLSLDPGATSEETCGLGHVLGADH